MLEFLGYPDKCFIIKSSNKIDDWGLPIMTDLRTPVRCRLSESTESIKLSGEKSDSYVTKYAICFPSDVVVCGEDKIEIGGKSYNIAKIKQSRDLSGKLMTSKVWV